MHRLIAALLAVALALGLTALAGCGDGEGGAGATAGGSGLTVFAAASLREVLEDARPGVRLSFAGSDQLALQIREGAPADVFVSANTRFPRELRDEGLLEEPVVFATNRLVVVVPRANPARIRSVGDLARDGVKLVLAEEGVPVGDYARQALEALDLPAALRNVVSAEDDVKAVVGKVALGEADAGVCYATDAAPVRDRVLVIEVPPAAQPEIEYGAGVVRTSPRAEAARAYLRFLRSPEGGDLLRRHGFGVPAR